MTIFVCRFSNFSKPLSQIAGMVPCCGWRSSAISATHHSDISAGFATESFAIPNRITGRTKWAAHYSATLSFNCAASTVTVYLLYVFTGIYSQAVPFHAETDRVWCAGRRHNNSSSPQQQEVARKTHHCCWDRHLCYSSEEEPGAQVGTGRGCRCVQFESDLCV